MFTLAIFDGCFNLSNNNNISNENKCFDTNRNL